jgi:hypothetical protein
VVTAADYKVKLWLDGWTVNAYYDMRIGFLNKEYVSTGACFGHVSIWTVQLNIQTVYVSKNGVEVLTE